jgi:hypothetical protein
MDYRTVRIETSEDGMRTKNEKTEAMRRILEALVVARGEFLDWEFSTRSGEDGLLICTYVCRSYRAATFRVRLWIARYPINHIASYKDGKKLRHGA